MKLSILVGPIASAKSTYAQNAAKAGYLCLNDDSIVNMVHADNYTLYDKNLKILYKTIENQIISMGLALNRPVLIDRGLNSNVNGRNRWLALAKSFDVPCEAVVFKNEGPEVHAKRRAEHDSRGHSYEYWLKVATFHQTNYVEPSLEEGFDKIYYISFEEVKSGKVY